MVITSDHGEVKAPVLADSTLARGAVSLAHGFGDLPDDDDVGGFGANPARLLSSTMNLQAVSRMPQLSAVPVSLRPAVPRADHLIVEARSQTSEGCREA